MIWSGLGDLGCFGVIWSGLGDLNKGRFAKLVTGAVGAVGAAGAGIMRNTAILQRAKHVDGRHGADMGAMWGRRGATCGRYRVKQSACNLVI